MAKYLNRPSNESLKQKVPNVDSKACFIGFLGMVLIPLIIFLIAYYFDLK